jgi:hypothetical protein
MITVPAGVYEGKLVDYGISETQHGDAQAFIVFEIEHEGPKRLTWYGLMNTKAKTEGKKAPIEFTVKTILDCGFTGEAIENMAAGVQAACFPIGKVMNLTIVDNEYINSAGNEVVTSKVQWVNVPGEGGVKRIDQATASTKINTGALRAELLKQRGNQPLKVADKNPLGI